MAAHSPSGRPRPLLRLARMFARDRRDILYVYGYGAFNGLVALSLPLGIQAIVGLILAGRVSTSWLILTAVVTLGIVLSGVLQVIQLSITEVLQQRVFTRAAFDFAYRIPRFRSDAVRDLYAPELVNRFFDTLNVQKGLSKLLLDFSSSALQILFGLLLLSFYHPFFIFFGIALLAVLAGIVAVTGRWGLASSLKESSWKYEVAHWLEELARGMRTFKLAGRTDLPLRRTDTLVSEYLVHRKAHFRVLVVQYGTVVAFKGLITIGLLLLGGLLVIENEINVGQFVASEIIIILIMNSAEKLILTMEPIYDVLTAVEKMAQVTDVPLEEERGGRAFADVDTGGGLAVELRGVSLPARRAGARPVLDGIDLVLAAGDRLCISGHSGSGKSTLLRLLAGVNEPVTGARLIHGVPVGNLDEVELRTYIGDCFEDEIVFAGTLEDNIVLGRPGVSFADLRDAAEAVGLAEEVEQWPQGYATELESDGIGLPASTVRRILLARAIVVRPRLLILDQTLRSFPPEERRALASWLAHPDRPWTLVLASNEPEVQAVCTRHLCMQAGRIVPC